jgi:hypothetical protein
MIRLLVFGSLWVLPATHGQAQLARPPVYQVTAKVEPAEHTGSCPVKVAFVVTITASAPGPVRFQVHTSDNTYDPVRELMFTAPGTKSFAVTRELPPPGSGWAYFDIVSPVKISSNKAYFDVKCTNPAGPAGGYGISTKIVPAEHVGSCPVKTAFTATITAPVAGPVRYQLHTSDNAFDPVRELMFTAPGTKSFAVTRELPPPGSGWAYFDIVSPVKVSSHKAYFDVKCTNAPGLKRLQAPAAADAVPPGEARGLNPQPEPPSQPPRLPAR